MDNLNCCDVSSHKIDGVNEVYITYNGIIFCIEQIKYIGSNLAQELIRSFSFYHYLCLSTFCYFSIVHSKHPLYMRCHYFSCCRWPCL